MSALLLTVFLLYCFSRRGAAAGTKSSRIGYLIGPSLSLTQPALRHSAGSARAWLRGEEKHCHRVSICRRKLDRLPALAAELVRLKVDSSSPPVGNPRRQGSTLTIPIVMTNDPDPVAAGFVASLARPGRTYWPVHACPGANVKRLELLREVVPKLSHVAILGTSTQPGYAQTIKEMEPAARGFNMQLHYLDVLDSEDIETAFRGSAKERAEGVITLTSPILRSQRARIADLAVKDRVPAVYNDTIL